MEQNSQPPTHDMPARFPDYFWAKTTGDNRPGISVRAHCLNVGCVAEKLLALLPSAVRDLLPAGATTLAALHDMGKITPGFQTKCDAWSLKTGWTDKRNYESNHALVSKCFLNRLFEDELLEPWAEAVGAHHGFPIEARNFTREPDNRWHEARMALLKEFTQPSWFGPLPTSGPSADAARWLFAGLLSFSDWIGSDIQFFSAAAEPQREPSEQRRCAKNALATLALDGKTKFEPGLSFEEAWGFEPYPFQKALVNWVDEPGVYVVEAPMGSGKTEAALFAAYQLISRGLASGLFFALPTQVTSNRIHERVERFLRRTGYERPEARLIHSGSWLVGGHLPDSGVDYPGETEWNSIQRRRWFASGRKALVAPYGVGTIDQALLGIIAVKFFFVRQFALAGKVVVLDEVHSYDAYTGGLLALLVRRLRELQCTVIILSATLTERHRRALLPEDLAAEDRDNRLAWLTASSQRAGVRRTACDSGLKSKPIRLRFEPLPGNRVVAECLERAAAGQCVLWICNTVDSAILTRKRLLSEWQERDEVKRPPIGLLHSRFPWHRRQQLETKWLRRLGKGKSEPEKANRFRPRGCVLVSTQVVEQSVDIDADFLVTELAPTDMLFQRLGRLWRHEFRALEQRGSATSAEALILSPDLTGLDSKTSQSSLGKWARVYDPFVLARSWRQWRGQPEVTVPDHIRSWLEATYIGFDAVADSQWSDLHDRYLAKRKALEALALNAANIEMHNPRDDDEDRAQTRLQTLPTAELLIAHAVVSENPLKLVLLDGSTVTLYERHFAINPADALAASRAIHRNVVKIPAWWLDDVPKPSLPALNQHFYGLWHMAVRQPSAQSGDLEKLLFHGGMPAELRLAYHGHEGVVLERAPTRKQENLDDDRFQFDD